MTAKKSLPQNQESINFTPDGWPINPLTGQPFTRDEIVSDETIPYPRHVDPSNPGSYWARRTPEQLQAEKDRIAKKSKARARRRATRSRRVIQATVPFLLSGAEIQTRQRGRAMADLVERANKNRPESRAQQLEFVIQDGPHYDPATSEWVVIVDGDEVAWAETKSQAQRSYDELTTPDEPRSILVTSGYQFLVMEV